MNQLIFDSHCDTITKLMHTGKSLYENTGHLDIKRMKQVGLHVQCFAAWISPKFCPNEALQECIRIIDTFNRQIESHHEHIAIAKDYNDIIKNQQQGKLSAILSIEGGDAVQGELSALRIFHQLGVRAMTLTWNYANQIADGVKDDGVHGGLTEFGVELVKEMNYLGMMVDVSHLSEKSFWDVLKVSEAPVYASHSNAKMLCNHPRNLTDQQIKAIADMEGIIGINFYPPFVKEKGKVKIEDIAAHIQYIKKLVGVQYIGMGGDYDGIDETPEGMEDILGYGKLYEELKNQGFSISDIEKIFYQNYISYFRRVVK